MTRSSRPPRRGPARGFTLVELVITLVLFGIMAATLVVFFKPAFSTYLASRSRAMLVAEADQSLRRLLADVRAAVPNSLRMPADQCIELIPSLAGGRYRLAVDTVNAGSAAVDPSAATSSFDVLSPLSALPAVGDWVVVDNQNPGDVYSGANRSAVTAVSTPAATLGRHRLAINPLQFPLGYEGGRFTLVADAQKAVFYVCSGADGSLDSDGNGRGELRRVKNYGFNAAMPSACPAAGSGDLLANGLRSCRFVYNANQGATQQSGYLALQLEFSRSSETASLIVGAHVANQP